MGSTSCPRGGNLVQRWPGKQLCWVGPADTHVWAGDECFIPRPGRRGNRMPITRQEAGHAANAHGEPGCFRDTGGTGVLPHRPRAWGAGSSADTRTRTTLVTIPAHSGTTQTESITGRVGIPGTQDGTGPGCWLSRGVAQREGVSFLHTLQRMDPLKAPLCAPIPRHSGD